MSTYPPPVHARSIEINLKDNGDSVGMLEKSLEPIVQYVRSKQSRVLVTESIREGSV